MERLRAGFEVLADPRTGNARRHDLLAILLIALVAMLCGAESCVGMALFGRAEEPFRRRFLRLEGGVPGHDTCSRIFRLLDPDAFAASCGRCVAALAAPGDEVVALDGTTARRSIDRQRGRRPLHRVSARAVERRLVPGQHKVGGASDEIEALPELLARLALDGRLVTADAMHCQKATARTILGRGGDHVRALKGNQPAPYADVRLGLDDPTSALDDVCPTVDGDPGRIETRRAMVAHAVAWLAERHDLPGLAAVAKVSATRESAGKTTPASRHSLLAQLLAAARLAHVVRSHWRIGSRRHRVLDGVMERTARAPARTTLPQTSRGCAASPSIGCAPTRPGRHRGKIKRAGWDDTFLLQILIAA